jgi:hypothetical protein
MGLPVDVRRAASSAFQRIFLIFSFQEFIHIRSVFGGSEHSSSENRPEKKVNENKKAVFSKIT